MNKGEEMHKVDDLTFCQPAAKKDSRSKLISEKNDIRLHWDNTYAKKPDEQLGWYERDLSATLRMIDQTRLGKEARLLNVGAGTSLLIDALLDRGFSNIIASDISNVALNNLRNRVGDDKVEYIYDDLSQPGQLKEIKPIDLWIDRAVLHFFTEAKDRNSYFSLLNRILKKDGFALFAQFSLEGADKCSGLPVHRYSVEILKGKLSDNYAMVDSFDYLYTMPSGDLRPYIYALFRKL